MSEQSSTQDEGQQAQPESFISHLIELRDRLLRSVIVVLIVFIPAAIFSGKLFTLLAAPMLSALSTDGTMISTEVAGPFLVPLKFAFALSIAVAIPYLLYQIWSFIAPGLYDKEKRLALPLLLSSTILFYCGIAFAYFVVFPIMFSFFPSVAPVGIEVTPDINHYLGFVIKLFFAFGIAFEVPIATILLIKAGITTREKLAKKRQYVVLGAFVVGMLLTPPDIFSQSMLAIPMWLLFELGLIMSGIMGAPITRDDEDDEDTEDGTDPEPDPDNDPDPGPIPGSGSTTETVPAEKTAQEFSNNNNSAFRTDEEDVLAPSIMPQQENYDESSDSAAGEEDEDLDQLAKELDELEDITHWVQPENDKPAKKKKKTKSTKKKSVRKKAVKKKAVKKKAVRKKTAKKKQ